MSTEYARLRKMVKLPTLRTPMNNDRYFSHRDQDGQVT